MTDPAPTSPPLLPFLAAGPAAAVPPAETLLGVLPGATENRRTAVLRRRSLCGAESVCLRDESFSRAVGWFPQGSVELAADRLPELRVLLGLAATGSPATGPAPVAHAARAVAGSATGPATVPFRLAG